MHLLAASTPHFKVHSPGTTRCQRHPEAGRGGRGEKGTLGDAGLEPWEVKHPVLAFCQRDVTKHMTSRHEIYVRFRPRVMDPISHAYTIVLSTYFFQLPTFLCSHRFSKTQCFPTQPDNVFRGEDFEGFVLTAFQYEYFPTILQGIIFSTTS